MRSLLAILFLLLAVAVRAATPTLAGNNIFTGTNMFQAPVTNTSTLNFGVLSQIRDSSGNLLLDPTAHILYDQNNHGTVQPQQEALLNISGNIQVDWAGMFLNSNANPSIDWNNRLLMDNNAATVFNWSSYTWGKPFTGAGITNNTYTFNNADFKVQGTNGNGVVTTLMEIKQGATPFFKVYDASAASPIERFAATDGANGYSVVAIPASGGVQMASQINQYNGITTAGQGAAWIVGATNIPAVTGSATLGGIGTTMAVTNLCEFSGAVTVKASVAGTLTVTLAWTDDAGNAQSVNIITASALVAGTPVTVGPYPFITSPSSVVKVSTTRAGTSATYTLRCAVKVLQ